MALLILTTAAMALAAPTATSVSQLGSLALAAPTKLDSKTHYGNPANGCKSDETATQLQGAPGSWCAPSCSASSPCPTDEPNGVTVQGQCVVTTGGAQDPTLCALVCDPGSEQCGPMGCHKVSGAGICTYSGNPSPSPPGPSPPPPGPSPPSPSPPGPSSGFCSDLDDYLPDFCKCKDVDDGAHVLCSTTVLDQDLQFSLLVAPCADPATIKFEIQVDGVPWDYSVTAGDSGSVDIPGLSFGIGPLTAGAVLDYTLSGNAEALEIKLGIDACAQVFGVKECGSDITSELPLNILDEKINFGACAAAGQVQPHLAFLRK